MKLNIIRYFKKIPAFLYKRHKLKANFLIYVIFDMIFLDSNNKNRQYFMKE